MESTSDTLIDAHVHIFSDGLYEGIRQSMEAGGCSHINFLSVPRQDGRGTYNEVALSYKKIDPERFYCFGALDYSGPNGEPFHFRSMTAADRAALAECLGRQPAQLKAQGFDGIKIIEGAAGVRRILTFPLDGEIYAPFFAAAEKERMPLTWHVGDSPERWDPAKMADLEKAGDRVYNQPGDQSLEAFRAEAENVLRRHPNLIVIFAHYYFLGGELQRARDLLRAYPNVCLDVTPGGRMYKLLNDQWDEARQFHIDCQDRLIFGTDLPGLANKDKWPIGSAVNSWRGMRAYFASDGPMAGPCPGAKFLEPGQTMRALNLPQPALAKLLRENFRRIVGKAPARLP
ncbi:MAG: amidohydrolase family protein [Candidatus Sumerlaeota bacterium]|nr:amidohydrolase family protein [Candidatus Sumerlaeota bacterium]